MFAAVLLLPLCAGMIRALFELTQLAEMSDVTLVPLLAGAGCMFLVYHWVPKPMWIYVFGHEFTHAAATMIFGGRASSMKVTSNGGHVFVTKDNFIVTLAPYFVPIYTAVIFVVFAIGRALWCWDSPLAWGGFFWALGVTYSFHVLLTWHILHSRQPDITSQGYFFSAMIIVSGNILILLFGLPHLTDGPGMWQVCEMLKDETMRTFRDIAEFASTASNACNSILN